MSNLFSSDSVGSVLSVYVSGNCGRIVSGGNVGSCIRHKRAPKPGFDAGTFLMGLKWTVSH
jgi:hypothetical protein